MAFLIGLLIVIAVLGLDFIVSAGLYKVICWCFGLVFSWKIALGLWIILVIISGLFRQAKSSNS